MKFYQKTKKSFEFLGLSSNQGMFNRKVSMFLTLFWLDVVLNWMYVFRVAETFGEYAESVFTTTTTTMFTLLYTNMVINWNAVNEVIDGIDKLTERSKFIVIG